MEEIVTNKLIAKVLDRTSPDYDEEIKQVFNLRYREMILDYNPNAPKDGVDMDDYDKYCDHIVVIDQKADKIVGTYRFMLPEHIVNLNNKYLLEKEYNIDDLKNKGLKILEVGRAVVDSEYRNGTTLTLLWKAAFKYAFYHNMDLMIGTASFHGNDPTPYTDCYHYLEKNYLSQYNAYAINSVAEFKENAKEIDEVEVIRTLPPLVKGYVRGGAHIGKGMYIDNEFNSVDILVIVELNKINARYREKFVNK